MSCTSRSDSIIAKNGIFTRLTTNTLATGHIRLNGCPLRIVTSQGETVAVLDANSLDVNGHFSVLGIELDAQAVIPGTHAATVYMNEQKELYFGQTNLLASTPGPPGRDACDGPDGIPGPIGDTGVTGPDGGTGPTGCTGRTGPDGRPGRKGYDSTVNGQRGPQGPPGASQRGPPGRDGTTGMELLFCQNIYGDDQDNISLPQSEFVPLLFNGVGSLSNLSLALGETLWLYYRFYTDADAAIDLKITMQNDSIATTTVPFQISGYAELSIQCTFKSAINGATGTIARIFSQIKCLSRPAAGNTTCVIQYMETEVPSREIVNRDFQLHMKQSDTTIGIISRGAQLLLSPARYNNSSVFNSTSRTVTATETVLFDQFSQDVTEEYPLNNITLSVGHSISLWYTATVSVVAEVSFSIYLDEYQLCQIPFESVFSVLAFAVTIMCPAQDTTYSYLHINGSTENTESTTNVTHNFLPPVTVSVPVTHNAILSLRCSANPTVTLTPYLFRVLQQ